MTDLGGEEGEASKGWREQGYGRGKKFGGAFGGEVMVLCNEVVVGWGKWGFREDV